MFFQWQAYAKCVCVCVCVCFVDKRRKNIGSWHYTMQKRKVYIERVRMDVAQLVSLPNGDPRVMGYVLNPYTQEWHLVN